jgi:hypothetical protein
VTSQRQHRKAKARYYERCVVCGKPKKIPEQMQKGVTRADFDRDEFCSTECCRAYYDGAATVSA